MIELKLPDVAWIGAQDGVEALLDKWLVTEGAPVVKGQVLAAVMLVKAAIDIEAPEDGSIQAILVKDGESFAPGKVLANFQKS